MEIQETGKEQSVLQLQHQWKSVITEYSHKPTLTLSHVHTLLTNELSILQQGIVTSETDDSAGQTGLLQTAVEAWDKCRDVALLYLMQQTQTYAANHQPEISHLYAQASSTVLFDTRSLLFTPGEAVNRARFFTRNFDGGKTLQDVGFHPYAKNDTFIKEGMIAALWHCADPEDTSTTEICNQLLIILQDPQLQDYYKNVNDFVSAKSVSRKNLLAFIQYHNTMHFEQNPNAVTEINTTIFEATIRQRYSMVLLQFLDILSGIHDDESQDTLAVWKICRLLAAKRLLPKTLPDTNEPTSCLSWLQELRYISLNLERMSQQNIPPEQTAAVQALGIAYAYNIARDFAPPIRTPWKGSYQEKINEYWPYIEPGKENAPTDPKELWKLFLTKVEEIVIDAVIDSHAPADD